MALFKIFRGKENKLKNIPYHEGYAYFCEDTHNFWIDTSNEASGRLQLNAYAASVLKNNNTEINIDDIVLKNATIPVEQGGTGATTLENNAILVGSGTEPIKTVKGTGALHIGEDGVPQIGVLPIEAGGTGNTTGVAKTAETADKLTNPATITVNLGQTTSEAFDGTGNITVGITGVLPKEYGGTGNATGSLEVNSTAKLETARNIKTNLASTEAAAFDGTADITPGVDGILPIANGGTGNTTGAAKSADQLTNTVKIRTNLASEAEASFNGTASVYPGIQGVLPITHGGTGRTDGAMDSAARLNPGASIRTNLSSTTASTFTGTANITPGVTGTLAIGNGGTGATTAADARSNLGAAASNHTHTGYLSTSGGSVNGNVNVNGDLRVGNGKLLVSYDNDGINDGEAKIYFGNTNNNSTFIGEEGGGTTLKLQGEVYSFMGGNVGSSHPLPIASGGTGANNASTARTNIGAAASNHSHSGYASSSHTHSGYLSTSGGTVSGTLTVQGKLDVQNNVIHMGTGNSGCKINFGDGDYVYISEANDDHLTISAKSINFVPYQGTAVASSNPLPKEWGGTGTTTGGGSSSSGGYVTAGRKSGTTLGDKATAEGYNTTASNLWAHAEGADTIASGKSSHAEGMASTASGQSSHAEGDSTTASGNFSHAEGGSTTASGGDSHAEGYKTRANGSYSHAEGYDCAADGIASHAGGYQSYAYQSNSSYAFAHGYSLSAGQLNFFVGKYNLTSGSPGSPTGTGGCAFAVGNGTGSRSNAFRVDYSGDTYTKTNYHSSGADYAEYFEWLDGNPNDEDRVGYFVTLQDEKIRKANPGDYILGIVSGQPCIIGNSDEDWRHRWIADDFGRFEREEISIVTTMKDIYSEDGQTVICQEPVYTTTVLTENAERPEIDVDGNRIEYSWRYKENPDYDSSLDYVERKDRKEWDAVGMMGVLAVRDDGTCQKGEFCAVKEGGIATASDNGYFVMGRVTDNIIKVIMR